MGRGVKAKVFLFGDNQGDRAGNYGDGVVVAFDHFAIDADVEVLRGDHFDFLRAAIDDLLAGFVEVAAFGVGADDHAKAKEGHGLEDADVDQAIVVKALGGAAELAADVLALGQGGEEDLLFVELFAVGKHFDVVEAAVLHRVVLKRIVIRVGAFFDAFGEAMLFIVVATRAHDCVEAEVDDVDRIKGLFEAFAFDLGEVDGFGFAFDEGLEVLELLFAAVDFDEVVAGAAGNDGEFGILEADEGIGDFVDGAIATAGIDADLVFVLG